MFRNVAHNPAYITYEDGTECSETSAQNPAYNIYKDGTDIVFRNVGTKSCLHNL